MNAEVKPLDEKVIITQYRYERKFFITELSREQVIQIVKNHPACFREVFHERYINNIYFDSHDQVNYIENVEGNADRTKYRIRWYGDLMGAVKKPVLELKIKKSLLGKKRSFKLSPFTFDKTLDIYKLRQVFKTSVLDGDVAREVMLQDPLLVNRYRRRYYLSADNGYRITIDDDQSFYKIKRLNNTFLRKDTDKTSIILELKYDQSLFNEAHKISNLFPFRMTKSSKYVRGVDSIHF